MKCELCQDTGKIKNDFGIDIICECRLKEERKEDNEKVEKPFYHVTKADKKTAVVKRLIPENRMEDEFNEDILKSNIADMCRLGIFKISGYNNYIKLLYNILNSIKINQKLDSSYLIGAPNGFGKSTFVTTCLKLMDSKGMKAVPYISLLELEELLSNHRKKLLEENFIYRKKKTELEIEEYIKTPEEVCVSSYSWNEYIQSDILFTYFTSLENKVIESNVLKTILSIRSNKGLPTVVFISTSIDPYLKDENLNRYIWSEILAYRNADKSCGLDRLNHVSVYKKYDG